MDTTQQFSALCEEYMSLVTRRNAAREEVKEMNQRLKGLEAQVQSYMEENNITELPFPGFKIKMKETQSRRAPKREEIAELLANELSINKDDVIAVLDAARSTTTRRSIRATRTS